MFSELLSLSLLQVATLMLVLFLLAMAFRCGWGVGAWLSGRLR